MINPEISSPNTNTEQKADITPVDPVHEMGKFLTMFAERKDKIGPTTIYEFKQQKELETDALTNLGNERMLVSTLTKLTEIEDTKQDSSLGLLMFDLDGFKAINDTLGHQFGDKVLELIGKKLPETLRQTDKAAHANQDMQNEEETVSEASRKHGDEFYVITPDLDDTRNGGSEMSREERHEKLAERVESELTEAVMSSDLGTKLQKNGLTFGLSVGTTIYKPGLGVKGLLKKVDEEMYKTKKAKK